MKSQGGSGSPAAAATRYDARLVGLFDRFGAGRAGSRRKAAHSKELSGDLAAAVDLYLEAELPDEAARVLLLRADTEPTPERRVAFCALAARTAKGEDLRKRALARKARLAFDMLKGQGRAFHGGALMKSELLAVARELEETGELELSADAFALAGDTENEVRVLASAGAIDRLEERLHNAEAEARAERERSLLLRRIADLDRTAERRAALELAQGWLARHDDPRVTHIERGIRARLARGPVLDLEIDGEPRRVALGQEVTVGRGDATIVIASRAVSRRHVRVFRGPLGPMVEDLGTRNGTTLAGARLASPIPIGEGVRLELGSGVPCSIEPLAGARGTSAVTIAIAGDRFIAPLGELDVVDWRLDHEAHGDLAFVVLRTPAGVPRPVLGDYELAPRVELCVGDALAVSRGGPIRLRLVGGLKEPDAGGALGPAGGLP